MQGILCTLQACCYCAYSCLSSFRTFLTKHAAKFFDNIPSKKGQWNTKELLKCKLTHGGGILRREWSLTALIVVKAAKQACLDVFLANCPRP